MEREWKRAKKAVESLFWDTCYVEFYREKNTEWGETQHEKGEGESFPCRLTEKAVASGEMGLLAKMEKTVILLYPAEKNIPAGSSICVKKDNGEERKYIAAGDSQIFLTHKAVGLKRSDVV